MTVATNPKSFTITDAEVAAQQVTGFNVVAGTASGGPYTAATASIAVSAMTLVSGVYEAAWSALTFSPVLAQGQIYFMVVEAVNVAGASGPSALSTEQQVELLAPPSPPSGFTVT